MEKLIRIGDTFYQDKIVFSFIDKLGSNKKPLAKNMLVKLCNMNDKIAGYAWGKNYISENVFMNIARKEVKHNA